jgi:hypothetical protein
LRRLLAIISKSLAWSFPSNHATASIAIVATFTHIFVMATNRWSYPRRDDSIVINRPRLAR